MTLEIKKKILTEYLKMKVFDEDWHGVSDAANDLREIYIAIKLQNNVTPIVKSEGLTSPIARKVAEEFTPPIVPKDTETKMVGLAEGLGRPDLAPKFNPEATDKVLKVMDMLRRGDEELANIIFPDGAL